MKDEELKEILGSKKESVLKAFRNKLILDKWDGYSPVWCYNFLTNETEYISDVNCIKPTLMFDEVCQCFLEKEDLDTYKWFYSVMETEIHDRLLENFKKSIDSFVDVRDLALGDKYYFGLSEQPTVC